MSREALVLLVCCCDFRDGAEWLIPSKSLRNAVIRAFPGLLCILRMCAPRRAAAVVRPRGREKSADRRRRILISRLLIIRTSVPRRKSPFPAYFKGFPAVSPLIPPYPAFLKYPVSPHFFSGSGTTAQAVMEQNSEDDGHRKYVMIQIEEECDPDGEAYRAGFRTICDIGQSRIKAVAQRIKDNESLLTKEHDVGFRVFTVADSNMKDVYYAADELDQQTLADMVSNIKEDRTALDLFFGCLLDWGLPLSMPYHSEEIDGCTVHTYNDGDLIACFDKNIPESVVKEIAKRKPLRAVFRDAGFADSPAKINVFEIFKLYMPEDADDITKRVKVL